MSIPRERRTHPRIPTPVDGSWKGASGGGLCRISDVSLSGCFVQSLAVPTSGEITTVTLKPGTGQPIVLQAVVVYVERAMGFGVHFRDMPADVREQLTQLLSAGAVSPDS